MGPTLIMCCHVIDVYLCCVDLLCHLESVLHIGRVDRSVQAVTSPLLLV
jgi:hypothetical protein